MTAITSAPSRRSSRTPPRWFLRARGGGAMQNLGNVLLALGLTLPGCAARVTVPVDPKVDFAAHVGHSALVVDRAHGGEPAVLVPARTLPFSSGPTYLLQAQDKTIADHAVNVDLGN
jgi:hypothetical protein